PGQGGGGEESRRRSEEEKEREKGNGIGPEIRSGILCSPRRQENFKYLDLRCVLAHDGAITMTFSIHPMSGRG
ncbi:MAG TPA: hypothetical protein VE082_08070, partial [Desulfobaccales bacterium]|nr:hypothetical protein [Desulfobaccales bacterium]